MCTAYLPVVTNKRVLCVWNSAFTQREAHTRCEKGNPKYFRGVMRPKLFIFGLGYVGLELGLEAQRIGWSVSGSVRSAEKAQLISARSGIDAHTFDLDEHYSGLDDAGRSALMEATHLVATVPPIADLDRDPLLALHEEELLRSERLQWAGYLSTTSVYGDHGGAWVDETSDTLAASGSAGEIRLRAERAWLDLEGASDGKVATRVFRLAGIYGPGRSALDTVARSSAASSSPPPRTKTGTAAAVGAGPSDASPPAAAPDVTAAAAPNFVSRIHVADISAALLAAMALDGSGGDGDANGDGGRGGGGSVPDADCAPRVFNLADDEPAPRAEVMGFAASLLGAPRGAAAAADAAGGENARAKRRARERKRVSNERMRRVLLPPPRGLAFPTYREGLRHISELWYRIRFRR